MPFTTTLGAALVLATALVTSAVAAVPVSLPVLAGEALAEADEPVADALALDEPVVVAAAGVPELLDELHAVAAAASAAARMTAGTARPRPAPRPALLAGNHAGTMRDPRSHSNTECDTAYTFSNHEDGEGRPGVVR